MLKELTVRGLNGRINKNLQFHPDINIITGKNGTGKTTILKLLWYLLSGNVERLVREMTFDYVQLVATSLTLEIEWKESDSVNVVWTATGSRNELKIAAKSPQAEREAAFAEVAKAIATATGASLFFPTFRRMEGGYAGKAKKSAYMYLPEGIDAVETSMKSFADDMSFMSHRFVTSISTKDVIELLDRKFAEISHDINTLHIGLSEFITKRIFEHNLKKPDASDPGGGAEHVLGEISAQVQDVSGRRRLLLQPFSVLWGLVEQVMEGKNFDLGNALTIGDATNAISSEALSAGEKQMLSFLCYNAFYSDAVIFIDEPELSLHVDWQRILFSTLLEQQRNNQFIVATHSPFIYSKYSDKELILDSDRGE